MVTVEEFKKILTAKSADEIVDELILANAAVHVSPANQHYLKERLAKSYRVAIADVEVYIVGSAKLGFSISESYDDKKHVPLKRYRSIRPESDIDVAVVSPRIFRAVWDDLGRYAHAQSYFPWNSEKLGDYMVCGWLRPDLFPKSPQYNKCTEWWNLFNSLSRDRRYGMRKVRGGLYNSIDDLRRYHRRSVLECKASEELQ